MAFNTKINIDDQHVIQNTDTTLTLSGNTKYGEHPTFTGDTQIVDKKYVDDNIITGVTAGTTYDLGSPAAVSVGGIDVDYVLTGKTSNEIIQDMMYPSIEGTLTAPSMTSLVVTPGTSPIEIGTVCNLTVTGNFSRGSINPQYDSASPFRSGAANSYCFTGAGTNGSETCTANSAATGVTGHVIVAGSNTWGSCASFDIGVQPKDNKGADFDTPYAAGTTGAQSDTITGILPIFYGVSVAQPTANQALIDSGSKTVITSTGTVQITYGSQTSKWLWFATPNASTTKLGWYEGPTNKANIGTGSDLFNAPSTPSVNSPSACWSGETYKIYVSNISTDTSANAYCMTNAAQQ